MDHLGPKQSSATIEHVDTSPQELSTNEAPESLDPQEARLAERDAFLQEYQQRRLLKRRTLARRAMLQARARI